MPNKERWLEHRLQVDLHITVDEGLPLREGQRHWLTIVQDTADRVQLIALTALRHPAISIAIVCNEQSHNVRLDTLGIITYTHSVLFNKSIEY